jgi:hypothetical protein
MSIGTKFINSSIVGAYADCLYPEYAKNDSQLFDVCSDCCFDSRYDECRVNNSVEYCDKLASGCVDTCQENSMALGDSPLDAPTAFLFAMIAAYGAFAVYRRKMQQV